jgi:hypothetical protein
MGSIPTLARMTVRWRTTPTSVTGCVGDVKIGADNVTWAEVAARATTEPVTAEIIRPWPTMASSTWPSRPAMATVWVKGDDRTRAGQLDERRLRTQAELLGAGPKSRLSQRSVGTHDQADEALEAKAEDQRRGLAEKVANLLSDEGV